MPTYDFRCANGHRFERFFGRISEAPAEVECPECGAMATRQISGGAGLIFKGSGFYITDYGKDGKKDQRAAARQGTPSEASSAGGTKEAGSGAPASTGGKGDGAGAASSSSSGSSGAGAPASPSSPSSASE